LARPLRGAFIPVPPTLMQWLANLIAPAEIPKRSHRNPVLGDAIIQHHSIAIVSARKGVLVDFHANIVIRQAHDAGQSQVRTTRVWCEWGGNPLKKGGWS